MLNTATIVIGLFVAAVIIVAAYLTYREVKGGGCSKCSKCNKCKKQ